VSARKQAKLKPSKTKSDAAATTPPGLRERKRRQTRERLTRVAMALFLERGFEATTLDDIAAAAGISRRSFFHYFVSKEDVVFAWHEESMAALIAAVAARPAGESMLTAAENAISAMVRQLEPGETMAIAKLKHDNPALQARDQVKYEKLERALADALITRAGHRSADHKSERLQARLVAMIATGVMRIGGELWAAEGAREKPEAMAKRIFAAIRAILK
jgi:AcrR family transcriptional regulator